MGTETGVLSEEHGHAVDAAFRKLLAQLRNRERSDSGTIFRIEPDTGSIDASRRGKGGRGGGRGFGESSYGGGGYARMTRRPTRMSQRLTRIFSPTSEAFVIFGKHQL